MIIPGSDITVDSPDYTGTPDDWFEQATEITLLQAAERIDESWYILRSNNGYMLHRASASSNPSRRSVLDKEIEKQGADPQEYYAQIEPDIRLFMSVTATPPPWVNEDVVMARTAPDTQTRVLWSANPLNTHWRQVADGRHRVSNVEMAALDPKPVVVREVDDE